jgi:uncharacterized protein YukJ
MGEVAETLDQIGGRAEELGEEAMARLESEEYVVLVRGKARSDPEASRDLTELGSQFVYYVLVRYDPVLEWLRRVGTSKEALAQLEPLLDTAQRLFVFGEPFQTGLGLHNVHQNQGDPAGSQWWAENGIWQDGD